MTQTDTETKTYKAGYAALVGKPNVGKSTLLNSLLGQKLSIATHKPQTTRHRLLGILSRDFFQAIIIDTPGLIEPKYKLQRTMVDKIQGALIDADVVLLVTEVTRPEIPPGIIDALARRKVPVFLILNKCDLINRNEALPVIERLNSEFGFSGIIPVSALRNEGIEEVEKAIESSLPEHPPFYPPDQVTDQPERFFVAELVREQIFLRYDEELPYSTTVQIAEFNEKEGRKDVIRAEIIVDRESQKPIIIGRRGNRLKELGIAARTSIEEFLQRPVFLELHVKTREKWRNSEEWLKRFGY